MRTLGLCLVVAIYIGLAAGAAQGFWPFAGLGLSWSIFGLVAIWSLKPAQYLATSLAVATAIDLLAQNNDFRTLKLSLLVASLALLLASWVKISNAARYGLIMAGLVIFSILSYLSSSLSYSVKFKIVALNFVVLTVIWLGVYKLVFKSWQQKSRA